MAECQKNGTVPREGCSLGRTNVASMQYTDDSSTALGLSHRARVRRAVDAVAEVRDADLSPATRGIRALSRRIDALVADGMDAIRATDQALSESYSAVDDPVPGVDADDPERDLTPAERDEARDRAYLGASVRSLMAVERVGHGGSKKGRRSKSGTAGTWVCGECHTEWCGHRPRARVCRTCLQPRPCDCYSGRRAVVSARVSADTRTVWRASAVPLGSAISALAEAAVRLGGPSALPGLIARLADLGAE